MSGTSEFLSPPILELVLGVQFSPLFKMTSGHFGWFWQELGNEWSVPADGLALEDQFEQFEQPRWRNPGKLELRLEAPNGPGRFLLGHRDRQRLLQIQPTRFHFNWRRGEGFYPSYGQLIAEFEEMFAKFQQFAEKAALGPVAPNQWELTYIDAFRHGAYWETPADWSHFLPGLFGKLPVAEGLVLEHRAAEWSYEIEPKRGRLHVAARVGQVLQPEALALLLQMTARGPVGKGSAGSVRQGLDWGHDAALGTFLRVTSPEAQDRWRKSQ